ncbi:MAG TPA: SLC13 family permease [Candidatus Limnocylindria bacterium]|jgi:di/tricarboxylate transporter
MNEIAITFAVISAIVVLFVWGRLPVEVVAIGAALSLWATGVLTLQQSLAGFGDPTVLFIAALFVVSEALNATGVTNWAGHVLVGLAGESRTRLIVVMMLIVAALTAIVTVNASVAALLPVVVVTASRLAIAPSKLLIPLVFGAHAGSQLALTGSNVNLLVSEAALDYTGRPLGFFEFALVGMPLLAGTVVVVALLSDRLLPLRTPATITRDLSRHARTLVEQYGLSGGTDTDAAIVDRETGLTEVIIPPRSPFVGEHVFPGSTTDDGSLVVAAIQRHGRPVGSEGVELAVGDTLVLQGPWPALDARADDRGLIVVDHPEAVRRQTIALGVRAWEAIAILAAMVVLLVTGAVPPAVAGLLAAGAILVLRILSMEHAYRAISWTTVIMVASLLPLSTAMFETGAAEQVGGLLIDVVGDLGPYGLLAGLFVVTALFGQLISNTATALIMIPIAVSAAGELGVDPRGVLVSLSVAASAALLTPVATPVNLIAMSAAGYRFGDYWKLGLVVMLIFFIASVFIVPVFWPMT